MEKFPKEIAGFDQAPGVAEHLSESAAKLFQLCVLKMGKKVLIAAVVSIAQVTVPLSENRWSCGCLQAHSYLCIDLSHGGELHE